MINLNREVSTPIAITIIIVLAIVSVGGVFAYQYYYLFPEEETSEDETADWKTYRDDEYRFEIKYPSNFTTRITPCYVGRVQEEKAIRIEDKSQGIYVSVCNFDIGYKQILDRYPENAKIITIDNHNAILDKFIIRGGGRAYYYIEKTSNSSTFIDGFWAYPENDFRDESLKPKEEIVNKIISTFRFIRIEPPENGSIDWKTYRSDEYGFEIKYPKELIISYVEKDDFSGPIEYHDSCIDELAYYKPNGLRYCKSVVGFKDTDNSAVFGLFIYKKEKTPDLGNSNVWIHPSKDFAFILLKTGNEKSDIIENNWDGIISFFKLTDETGKISIKISYTKTIFNMENKSFETEDFVTKKKFIVITDDSTKFYKRDDDRIIEDGYSNFSDFANTIQSCEGINCPLVPTVEGILQDANTIKATDIYSFIQ